MPDVTLIKPYNLSDLGIASPMKLGDFLSLNLGWVSKNELGRWSNKLDAYAPTFFLDFYSMVSGRLESFTIGQKAYESRAARHGTPLNWLTSCANYQALGIKPRIPTATLIRNLYDLEGNPLDENSVRVTSLPEALENAETFVGLTDERKTPMAKNGNASVHQGVITPRCTHSSTGFWGANGRDLTEFFPNIPIQAAIQTVTVIEWR